MTLTFNTHIPSLTQSVVCINQLAGVSKSPLFSHFPIEKPKLPNLTLPYNKVNSESPFIQTL